MDTLNPCGLLYHSLGASEAMIVAVPSFIDMFITS